MEAKLPKGELEKRLMKKENWKLAIIINCKWWVNDCTCDFCQKKINGRHLIDGKLAGLMEFALMCPQCHVNRGEGFGEGKGQLYTKLTSGEWLLTFGFTEDQIAEQDDGFDEDDD